MSRTRCCLHIVIPSATKQSSPPLRGNSLDCFAALAMTECAAAALPGQLRYQTSAPGIFLRTAMRWIQMQRRTDLLERPTAEMPSPA